ncbi:hypothetical protein [Natronospirillum operosum]|nr:hypothetical protein [Natronospirillum operosum]
MTDEISHQVWQWLLDPHHILEDLLVRDADGKAVGMAHIRACLRPRLL